MHTTLTGKLVALAAVAATVATPIARGAAPQGGGASNIVVSHVRRDGAFSSRAHTQLAQVAGPAVADRNIASASATGCTGCHATAVAVQLLFVSGDPQYVAPENAAIAINAGCTSCGTFAYAWQYVLHVDRPTHLSAEAVLQEHELERQIEATATATQPDSLAEDQALQERLDELTSELRELVEQEIARGDLEPSGPPRLRSHVAF